MRQANLVMATEPTRRAVGAGQSGSSSSENGTKQMKLNMKKKPGQEGSAAVFHFAKRPIAKCLSH
jgi:hypothetical protein